EVSEKARVRFQVIDLTITAAFVEDPLEPHSVSILVSGPQPANITGTITDERGGPLPGVSVLVKGTSNGTASDVDGRYSIIAAPEGSLVFSFIGYETQETPVGQRTSIDITMRPSTQTLSEV